MASADTVAFEEMLAPIAGEHPCGEDLRYDPLLDEIRRARQETDRGAIETETPVEPDWALIVDKAGEALAGRSKDLMLAGYLIQGLLGQRGFPGLRDGVRVLNGLLETFWDSLYPQVEDGDLEPRAARIAWVTDADTGGRIPARIRNAPLTPGRNEGHVYSWSYWKARYAPPKGENEDDDAYERRRAEGVEKEKLFEGAVSAVPVDHFITVRDDLGQCMAEVSRLGTLLDQRLGDLAPGVQALKQALEDCTTLVRRIIKDKGGDPAEAPEGEEAAEGAPGAGQAAAAVSGPVKTRADALRRLAEVAAYFRQAEPHSPVSYLVERAAHWGRMPLEQLLSELVKDSGVREQIDELLGLRRD